MSTAEQKKAAGFIVDITAVIAGKKRTFRGMVICTGGWSTAQDIALDSIGEVERVSVVCKLVNPVKQEAA